MSQGSEVRCQVSKPVSSTVICLPTAAGGIWFLAALAVLATAINYGNNLIFALAFLLLAIWISSAWECWRNLRGLDWQPTPTPPAFAGEALHTSGNLRDTSGRRHEQIALCMAGKNPFSPALTGKAGNLHRESVRLLFAVHGLARGQRRLERLSLFSRYPLGLWRARRPLPPMTALLYPRPEGHQPLPASAPHPAHRRQESGDFQGVRAYVPGDSPRRVNWRIYGRREELAVNNFDGGQGGEALWLDMNACSGDTESRLSQLCQWILTAEQQGQEYGLRLEGGQNLPPGRGRTHQQNCLTRLALYGQERSQVEKVFEPHCYEGVTHAT
ncbi:hypothetical protein AGMMS49545_01080 [Betaproteobacteria bacterium]|nr:hypothetical protein AGMMS49545_01080 [Betaproteobacteria bacterium]GHU48478.1 hypothetical protein AGMMS50289_25100 [Betaproteobacteria bacterium]